MIHRPKYVVIQTNDGIWWAAKKPLCGMEPGRTREEAMYKARMVWRAYRKDPEGWWKRDAYRYEDLSVEEL